MNWFATSDNVLVTHPHRDCYDYISYGSQPSEIRLSLGLTRQKGHNWVSIRSIRWYDLNKCVFSVTCSLRMSCRLSIICLFGYSNPGRERRTVIISLVTRQISWLYYASTSKNDAGFFFTKHYDITVKLTFDLADIKCCQIILISLSTFVLDYVIVAVWILELWPKTWVQVEKSRNSLKVFLRCEVHKNRMNQGMHEQRYGLTDNPKHKAPGNGCYRCEGIRIWLCSLLLSLHVFPLWMFYIVVLEGCWDTAHTVPLYTIWPR